MESDKMPANVRGSDYSASTDVLRACRLPVTTPPSLTPLAGLFNKKD